ncbi:MAG: site-specific DNA-methyltransferase [Lactococcus lactis]|nr:site-specific DNA-methyltransferase [Lactococcus lactis]MDN5446570.1 site-specific DNA-methyltransferase [Lactococcus lactis]MDN5473928.1 site-specific DNA-methyltransferase [Lactococcus lactis]
MIKLNKIYNEDCLEGMKHIPDGSVDMILCDLPYGTTKNSWDSIIPLEKLWNHYKRVIKENGAIVLTAQTPFDKILGCSNLDMLRYEWIWEKNKATGHLNANKAPMKLTENILVFYKKSPIYNPQGVFKKHTPTIRKAQSNGPNYGKSDIAAIQEFENYPKNLLRFKLDINAFHPTQKPLSLFEYLIKTYTNKGDLVLDNCMGSGTTAVACLNTERNFIGFEKNIDYYEKSLKRIENNETQLELF